MSGPQLTRYFTGWTRLASIITLTVLASGGCASPRPPDATTRTVVASDASVDSGSPLDAAVAVAPVDADAATSPDAGMTLAFPRPTLEPGAYDWEFIRFSNSHWVGKPPSDSACDPRNGLPMPGHECLGRRRLEIAALLDNSDIVQGKLALTVDRGNEAMITESWYATILDNDGRPATPWSHPVRVVGGFSVFLLQRPLGMETHSGTTRVILVPVIPKEKR